MKRLIALFLTIGLLATGCGGDDYPSPAELAVPQMTTTTVALPDRIVIGDVLLDANDIFAAREVVADNSAEAEADVAAAAAISAATTTTIAVVTTTRAPGQPATVAPTTTIDKGVLALADAVGTKMVRDLGITDPAITKCLMGSLADAITLISQAQSVTADLTERLTFLAVDECNAGPSIFASSIAELGLPDEVEKCMIDNLDGELFEDTLANNDTASSSALISGLIDLCI